MLREHTYSDTFKHYDKVSDHVVITYGRDGTKVDSLNEDEVRI